MFIIWQELVKLVPPSRHLVALTGLFLKQLKVMPEHLVERSCLYLSKGKAFQVAKTHMKIHSVKSLRQTRVAFWCAHLGELGLTRPFICRGNNAGSWQNAEKWSEKLTDFLLTMKQGLKKKKKIWRSFWPCTGMWQSYSKSLERSSLWRWYEGRKKVLWLSNIPGVQKSLFKRKLLER